MTSIEELLSEWLGARAEPFGLSAFRQRVDAMSGADASSRLFETTFARIPRLLGDRPLAPSDEELAKASRARPRWSPDDWTIADAGRALLLLALERMLDGAPFVEAYRRLRQSADPLEQVALFRCLALLKPAAGLDVEAREGLRSNIPDVLKALSHGNPYPAENFDEAGWNQMILKALFVGVSLAPVPGVDARANLALAISLRDLARERRAAGRPTPQDLWRCLTPFAKEAEATSDLAAALRATRFHRR